MSHTGTRNEAGVDWDFLPSLGNGSDHSGKRSSLESILWLLWNLS